MLGLFFGPGGAGAGRGEMQEVKECVEEDVAKGERKQRVLQEAERSCLCRARAAPRVCRCIFALFSAFFKARLHRLDARLCPKCRTKVLRFKRNGGSNEFRGQKGKSAMTCNAASSFLAQPFILVKQKSGWWNVCSCA